MASHKISASLTRHGMEKLKVLPKGGLIENDIFMETENIAELVGKIDARKVFADSDKILDSVKRAIEEVIHLK